MSSSMAADTDHPQSCVEAQSRTIATRFECFDLMARSSGANELFSESQLEFPRTVAKVP